MPLSSPRPFVVRPIADPDFAAWLPLWLGYNRFYGRFGPTALPDKVTQTTWQRFLDPAEPMTALVAANEDRLLGLVHYLFHRSTNTELMVCYLQDLFVDEEKRGRGIGRALIEAVCVRAREVGTDRVYWHTHETNVTAMKLYDQVAERPGFIFYRIIL